MLLLFQWHESKMIRNKFPPKFEIANGFVIGSMPQVQQWTTADSEKCRVIAKHELTDLLKAMMAPVRPYIDRYFQIQVELKNL
jgi:hypothetical protein